MSRKVLLIFSGVFALVLIIFFSYLKYNVEIPGDKIFSNEIRLESTSIYQSDKISDEGEGLPSHYINEADKKKIIKYLIEGRYKRRVDKVFQNSEKLYRIFGNYKDKDLLVTISDNYILSTTEMIKDNKSEFYQISKDSADKIMGILNQYEN